MGPLVREFCVHLVADQDKVVVADDIRNCLQIFLPHHRTGGIVGEVDDQGLAFPGHPLHEDIGVQAELILPYAGDGDRHTTGKGHARRVGDVAGLCHQHLVSRIDHRADGNIQPLRDPGSDDHLLVRVIGEVIVIAEIAGQGFTECLEPAVGGVGCSSLLY
ncbi:MAG: hypothetical protein A4E40_00613 [Methanoregulaceae archaeon PtaU1.Bin059]|nr:MAG: hypothetical protein A4E40_00613 [Methanoregulaceae archaeon PtaU1.Bin059]